MTPRRLYRSRTDRQLAGVAGGIARYLDVDPTVVRVLWIFSIFFGGFGILLYIIMAFIVPLEPAAAPPPGWAPGGPAWGAPPASGPAWGAAPASGAAATTVAADAASPAIEAGTEPSGGGRPELTDGTSTEPGNPPAAESAAWADPSAAASSWSTTPSWQAQGAGWQPPAEREPGRGGLILGIAIVAFGGIALVNAAIPGWIAGGWVVAAVLVALGIALLVGAMRRPETAA